LSAWRGLFKCWLRCTRVLNVELHKKHSYATPFHERSIAHIVEGAGGSF
jgi:hypothetical protein